MEQDDDDEDEEEEEEEEVVVVMEEEEETLRFLEGSIVFSRGGLALPRQIRSDQLVFLWLIY